MTQICGRVGQKFVLRTKFDYLSHLYVRGLFLYVVEGINDSTKRSAQVPGSIYRSAKNGKFVTKKFANTHKATTLGEKVGGGPTGRSRSAKNGQFVSKETANKRPSTTVTEK